MKEQIMHGFVRGLILFIAVAVPVIVHTGSAALAEEEDANQPRIAVVDKRGVGQTQKEIDKGMNDEVVYDTETNTLTWNAGEAYQLMDDYTYYITFKMGEGEIKQAEVRR